MCRLFPHVTDLLCARRILIRSCSHCLWCRAVGPFLCFSCTFAISPYIISLRLGGVVCGGRALPRTCTSLYRAQGRRGTLRKWYHGAFRLLWCSFWNQTLLSRLGQRVFWCSLCNKLLLRGLGLRVIKQTDRTIFRHDNQPLLCRLGKCVIKHMKLWDTFLTTRWLDHHLACGHPLGRCVPSGGSKFSNLGWGRRNRGPIVEASRPVSDASGNGT